MRTTLSLALGLAMAGPALAQTAPSEAGAKAVGDALAVYLGRSAFETKVVTVVPEGKGYRITIAPNAAIAGLLEGAAKVEIAPYSILAAERSDGNWDVAASDPISVSFDLTAGQMGDITDPDEARSLEGLRQTGEYRFAGGSFTGVFAPKLGVFLSGTGVFPGGTIQTREPSSDVSATIGPIRYETAAKDVGAGAIDLTGRQTVAKIDETVSVKTSPEASDPTLDVRLAMAETVQSSAISGLRSRAILDLWAFAVAHADKDALVKDQEILRGLLGAALPIWTKADGTTEVKAFEVTSAFGSFAATSAKARFAMGGVSTASSFSYGMEATGLSTTSAMMPDWMSGLVPKDLSLTFKLDGLDIETPAKRALAEFDLAKDPVLSDATTQELAAAFAEHPPRLVVEPSRITSRDLDLTMEGQVVFVGTQPEATMTIEAGGLDKVISTLQGEAAKDPSVNEVVGMLALSQGFARHLPDGRAQWIVSSKADGSVILNGNQIVAPTPATDGDADIAPAPAPTDENALPTEDPATTTP